MLQVASFTRPSVALKMAESFFPGFHAWSKLINLNFWKDAIKRKHTNKKAS